MRIEGKDKDIASSGALLERGALTEGLDIRVKIPTGVFVQGAVHVIDIKPIPFKKGEQLEAPRGGDSAPKDGPDFMGYINQKKSHRFNPSGMKVFFSFESPFEKMF